MLLVFLGALYDSLPLIPLALGLVWTLRYQQIADLSLAGSFSIGAGVAAAMLAAGHGVVLALLAGLLVGVLVGLFMTLTVNVLRIEPLMSGLLVLFVSYAVSLGITQGTITIPSEHNPLEALLNLERTAGFALWMHPYLNLVFLLIGSILIGVSIFVFKSEWGCAFRALEDQSGGKAYLSSLGVSAGALSTTGFVVAALLASISGMLVAMRDGQATSSLGLDSLIEVIPAYVLGIALFEKRPRRIGGNRGHGGKSETTWTQGYLHSVLNTISSFSAPVASAMGIVLFFVIINAAQRWTGISWLPRVVIGVFIMLLLGLRPALDAWKRRRTQRRATQVVQEGRNLIIKDLTVAYATINGPLQVLDGLNLEATPGTVTLISGRNGCGKSTMLQ
ncbi:MAG: hypothetical protein KDC10_11280, partial [Calditrichaeota bacterium]|nr:hypothetical protein [Calditrichota bacterium]